MLVSEMGPLGPGLRLLGLVHPQPVFKQFVWVTAVAGTRRGQMQHKSNDHELTINV